MKIGIITINDNNNYGNRLQNYALQEIINELGFYNETIWNNINNNSNLFRRFKKYIKYLLCYKFYGLKKILYNEIRYKQFKKFTKKNINNSKFVINNYNLEKLSVMYDKFCVGSDQVWNYNFGKMTDIEFLLFTNPDKTLAYAPSFGVSKIEDSKKEICIKGLKHIKNISVREDAGAEIIKELIGVKVPVVLDPTLLLDKNKWSCIEKKISFLDSKKYILTYFLGNITKELEEILKKICKVNNYEIIHLNNEEYKKYYCFGPSEFLYLVHNAEYVFTDSFHACVFSLIYEKEFFVFDRNEKNVVNMNSRLETFLQTFNLNNRKINNISKFKINNYKKIEYEIVKNKLNIEKKKSLEFLKKSLN